MLTEFCSTWSDVLQVFEDIFQLSLFWSVSAESWLSPLFFLQLSCCFSNPFMLPSPHASSSSLFFLSDSSYSHIFLSEESSVYIMNLISTERSSLPPIPLILSHILSWLPPVFLCSLCPPFNLTHSFRSIFISPSLHEPLSLPGSLCDQCSSDERYDWV